MQYHRIVRLGGEVFISGIIYKPEEVEETSKSTNRKPSMSLPYKVSTNTEITAGTKIYTDGSRMQGSTSYAYCLEREGEFIHEYQALLRPPSTVYHAELSAISKAVEWAIREDIRDGTNLSDSVSSVLALSDKFTRSSFVQRVIRNCRNATLDLVVKGQAGIKGIERTVRLVVEAHTRRFF